MNEQPSMSKEPSMSEEQKVRRSPCCQAPISLTISDGVLVGNCEVCAATLLRWHPQTGRPEWLDGQAPWTTAPLRAVEDGEACRPADQQAARSEMEPVFTPLSIKQVPMVDMDN